MKKLIFFAGIALLFASCDKIEGTDNPTDGTTLTITNATELPTTNWTDRGADIDYIVKYNVAISSGKSLIIEKGVTVQFEGTSAGFTVTGTGILKMQGTANQPIRLQGASPVTGNWKGIVLESAHPDNVWDNVIISDAGSTKAGVYMSGTSLKPSMTNCTITNCGNYGLYLNTSTIEFISFTNNTISSCVKAPIYLYAQSVFTLGTGNKFSNNTNAYIEVAKSEMSTPLLWNKMDVPYRVSEIECSSKFEIKPGVIIEFNPNGHIIIGDRTVEKSTGYIVANGTSTEPIIFRGLVNNINGQWVGIKINSSNVENSMKYCSIINAGSSDSNCTKTNIALRIGRESKVCTGITGKGVYQNITIQGSGGYGVGYRSTDAPSISGFQYSNNTLGNIFSY